jgi:protein TonB
VPSANTPLRRPPIIGLPQHREQQRWQGWIASLLAHLFLLALIIVAPQLAPEPDLGRAEGAGGLGPAGGGGGGSRGGGAQERLQYVRLEPPAPAAASKAVESPVKRPVEQPVPVPPPKSQVTPTPTPTPSPPKAEPPAPPAPTTPVTSGIGDGAGSGSGTGTSSGTGAGSGTGGGVGSGEGTGRGSGVGPGTGGGNAANYPPTPRQVFLPPLPAPSKVRGFKMVAWFDVDSTGKATLLRFTPTPDAAYNKKLKETLLAMKFRPAVRPDGTAIRDTVDVEFVF